MNKNYNILLNEKLNKSTLNQEQRDLVNDYPILAEDDLQIARTTIFGLMDKDQYSDDRGHLVDYCNTAAEGDLPFFYEMIPALEFIPQGETAYTTPDKCICMSYPNTKIVPMDSNRFRRWYFVYCHECMHQLWDTFNVQDEIIKDEGECDFQLLNIASDCVINEYLANNCNHAKMPPIAGITAKVIKDDYGIDFNIKADTQRSLYDKLNKLVKPMRDALKQLAHQLGIDDQPQQGQGQQGQDQQGQQGQGQQGQGQQGQGQGQQGQQGQGQGQQGQDQQGQGTGAGGPGESTILTREMIEINRKRIEKILDKYKNTISGPLGEFVQKCKQSKKNGNLIMPVQKGGAHWDKKLMQTCNVFLKQKMFNLKKQYERTYSRIRRGERAFSAEDSGKRILKKGKKVRKDQIGFTMAVYVDVSSSMQGCIDRVFDVAYDVVDTMKKNYGKDKHIDPKQVETKMYVFDTDMREINYGSKCGAYGGTYSFHELLSDIHERNVDAFLNIVITDGEFNSIDDNAVVKNINDMDGLFILITNQPEGYFKKLARKVNETGKQKKLVDIYADQDFTI